MQIDILKDTDLTLQPCDGSILINTIFSADEIQQVQNLTYLNFLKKGGVVVDLTESGYPDLLTEAENINLTRISGSRLWAERDFDFLTSIFGGKLGLTETQYLEQWETWKNRPK